MTSDRVGVITFFGILVPGAYLAGILVLAVASGVELMGLHGHYALVNALSQETALFAGVFLFVAYLLGVLVRLFAPESVDILSEWYLVHIRGSKDPLAKDNFPYAPAISSLLRESGMGQIPDLMAKLNAVYGKPRNTPFFNYCKWFIDANDDALSRQVQEAEALVRFLSGTTLVLLIALPFALFFIVYFALTHSNLNSGLYVGLLTVDLVSLVLIFERFRHQRRREVIMVWGCVYLILNSGRSAFASVSPNAVGQNSFFTAAKRHARLHQKAEE